MHFRSLVGPVAISLRVPVHALVFAALVGAGTTPSAQRVGQAEPRPRVETRNLRLAVNGAFAPLLSGRVGAFGVSEASEGRDLNGDGDQADTVLFAIDPTRTGAASVTNTGLALTTSSGATPFAIDRERIAFFVSEAAQNADLDGNGTKTSNILFHGDVASGWTNTARTGSGTTPLLAGDWILYQKPDQSAVLYDVAGGLEQELAPSFSASHGYRLTEDYAVVVVGEGGVDRNGDGDTNDFVPRIRQLATGATSFVPVSAYDASDARYFQLVGDQLVWLVSEINEGFVDLTRDGDTNDVLLYRYDANSATVTYTGAWTSFVFEPAGIAVMNARESVWLVSEAEHATDYNGDGDQLDEVVAHHDAGSSTLTITPYAAPYFLGATTAPGRFLVGVDESAQGADLNGDGDTFDAVPHLFESGAAVVTNLARAVGDSAALAPGVLFNTYEGGEGLDLNGDGDTNDYVLQVYDEDGVTNLRVPAYVPGLPTSAPGPRFGSRASLFFLTSESSAGRDLNRDGDTADHVLHAFDRRTRMVFDARIAVALRGATSSNASSRMLAVVEEAKQGRDLNGDGDASDRVVHLASIER